MFSGIGQNLAKLEKLLQHNHVVAPRLEAATVAPGKEFRGEEIIADHVRNLVHQWKSSKGQDFSRLLSSYSDNSYKLLVEEITLVFWNIHPVLKMCNSLDTELYKLLW